MISAEMTLLEVAFEVGEAFYKAGSKAVLVGGSAAHIYGPLAYQSYDLDFTITLLGSGSLEAECLTSLGYLKRSVRQWSHAQSPFTVDLITADTAVGEVDWVEPELLTDERGRRLKILPALYSAFDRLLWFGLYRDFKALDAAIGVAKCLGADEMKRLEALCAADQVPEAFERLRAELDR